MKLVHSSISENGNSGWDGKAKPGDQTGKEVCVRSWYSKPWTYMIRYPNSEIGEKATSVAIKLANSGLVGYDQSDRDTMYRALKRNNFDVDAYIRTGEKTECDCSSFVYACYACFLPEIRRDSTAPRTADMKGSYGKWGFKCYTNAAYLRGENLQEGDILLKPNGHTAMATDGVLESTPTTNTEPVRPASYPPEISRAIELLALDVIAGHWGNGEQRKNALYGAIQARVNELIRG